MKFSSYRRWITESLAITVLIFQPLFFYRRHLFQRIAHIPFDIQSFHLPLAAFISRTVWNGEWPFWNPDVYAGVPIHADIQAQLFYPITWAAILVDRLTGGARLFYWMEWLVAVHMIIGGVGAYLLFRHFRFSRLVSLFGATVFQIGPFFVSQAQHLGAICTAAWFPVVLLCLFRMSERPTYRRFGWLTLTITLDLLAGFPAAFVVVIILSCLVCVGLIYTRQAKSRLLAYFAASVLLSAGIAAVQLIPTIQLSGLSIASIRYRWLINGGGLHWESLVSVIWPNYYHIFSAWDPRLYKLPYQFTFLYTFCGHIAVLQIALAPFFLRKSKLLRISFPLLLFSIVWMLGENTPLYPMIYKHLPHFVQNFMYAEYALLGFSMFAAIAVTCVLACLEPKLSPVLVAVIVAMNSWNLIRMGTNKDFNQFDGSYAVATASWQDAGGLLPDAIRTLTKTADPPLRIEFLSDVSGLLMGSPLYDLSSVAGDNPFLLLRYYELRRTSSDDYEWTRRLSPRNLDTPWIRGLNVGYVFDSLNAPAHTFNQTQYELLPFTSARIYKVKEPLPRFYLQNKVVDAGDEKRAIDLIRTPGFDPAAEAVVEGLRYGWKPDSTGPGSVTVLRYQNNGIELDVQTPGRTLLVTSEPFYPGWTAKVNGRSTPILATNLAFRGIALEAGPNHIEMSYAPEHFTLAVMISLASLLVCSICIWRR